MVASVETAVLAGDEGDGGLLWAVPVISTAYVPGELLPALVGGGDAPTVTLVSPPAGTPLRAGDAVVFDITSALPFILVAFRVRFVATDDREAAYDRDDPAGAWDPRYAGSSVVAITGGYRLTLKRSSWPGGNLGILPRVTNAGGLAP